MSEKQALTLEFYAMITKYFGGVSGFDAGDETHRCMPRAHFLS